MIYLYDNSIVHDLEQSLAGSSAVRVISPEQIVGIAAQIQNDEIQLPIIALERNDYAIDTDRLNFSRMHFGLQTVIDLKTNELYYERAIPVTLSYGITILTSNQIDMDEIVKEPAGGAQKNHELAAANVKKAILKALASLKDVPADVLLEKRYAKLRALGNFY